MIKSESELEIIEFIIANGKKVTFNLEEEDGLWILNVYADEEFAFLMTGKVAEELEAEFWHFYAKVKKIYIHSKTREALSTGSKIATITENTGVCVYIDNECAFVLTTPEEREIFKELTGM
jgi:hypothetical protein